jgi:hypothetical protein
MQTVAVATGGIKFAADDIGFVAFTVNDQRRRDLRRQVEIRGDVTILVIEVSRVSASALKCSLSP